MWCIIMVPVCYSDVSEEEQVSLCFCCVHLLHARAYNSESSGVGVECVCVRLLQSQSV